ncbi:MAG: ABC transporter ATP-binding protein [Planctomycetota bacterium]|jgi:ABC-type polysaccharide/polyol phosphate transport system ATPase subunit|nr:ABC transporter ATP-binding protein [Planctomycetota bacterium]
MSDAAVIVKDLVKEYRMYSSSFDRLKESLSFGRKKFHSVHRALDGVSFELPRGKALGVIGENGAGKSTLLKVLAGTSMATSGTAEVKGSVASLLELGTGFHSEFDGRANIFLSAQVLGFSLKEVTAKVDEIIAFAELGDYINKPVRTYSSGMVMRLGFAVATAIDPEVLIIDEILAVGDLYFQKKCVDRIFNFRNAGKSILFCSHSLYDVRQICDEVVWIKDGKVEMQGSPQDVTIAYANYERALSADESALSMGRDMVEGEGRPQLEDIRLLRVDDGVETEIVDAIVPGVDVVVEMEFELFNDRQIVHVGVGVFRNDNVLVISVFSHLDGMQAVHKSGRYRCRAKLPNIPLVSGEFNVMGYLIDETFVHAYDTRSVDRPLLVLNPENIPGMVACDCEFTVESLEPTA